MYYLLFILSLWISETPHPSFEIASGTKDDLPTEWIPFEDIEDVSIGESYWVKVHLSTPSNDLLTLQGGNWYMQNIHFYSEQLDLLHIGNAVNLEVESAPKTYYLFYPFHDEKDPDFFSITLSSQKDFLAKQYSKNIFQSVFSAILIFVLLVCVFFVFGSSGSIYINYILYISSILIFFSYQYGILGELITFVKNVPPTWMWILSASISFTYVMFSRSFLDMKTADPFNYKVSTYGLYFIALIVFTESAARIFSFDILHQLWYKSIILILEFGIMIVFIYRIAMMKTLISSIFLIGALILVLSSLTGQVASTFKIAYETNRFVQTGLLMDVFILSIGIAVKVNLIQKERRDAQQKLIEQLRVNERLQQEYLRKLEKEVSERTSDLDKRNTENITLLKEVHHRVKNNLQMITSLLSMQQRRLKEKDAKDALALTKNRVKSIALIHEHLYKHDDFSKINMANYVEELVFILIDSLYRGSHKIKTNISVKKLMADIETAIPIGLILNELITNSIKHALSESEKPYLQISLSIIESELVLDVIDNGKGMKKSSVSGFGNTIINALIESNGGVLDYPKVDSGFHARIILKNFKVKELTNDINTLD